MADAAAILRVQTSLALSELLRDADVPQLKWVTVQTPAEAGVLPGDGYFGLFLIEKSFRAGSNTAVIITNESDMQRRQFVGTVIHETAHAVEFGLLRETQCEDELKAPKESSQMPPDDEPIEVELDVSARYLTEHTERWHFIALALAWRAREQGLPVEMGYVLGYQDCRYFGAAAYEHAVKEVLDALWFRPLAEIVRLPPPRRLQKILEYELRWYLDKLAGEGRAGVGGVT